MNRRITFTALAACFLHLVFANAAETNHNFAVWEKEISAFEKSDKTNPPPKHATLFIGSSTIRMWTTLAQDFPKREVINRGFGGCEIVDCTHFADRIVFPYEPRLIVFRAGGNDLWAGKSAEQVFADFKEFVATVHQRLPKTEIVFISWSPTVSRWSGVEKEKALNRLAAEYCLKTPRLKYIETSDLTLDEHGQPRADLLRADKLHLNAEGYKLLAERVRSQLPE
ncbi:MAG TPA: GDSL-type esterase/lipase family protein [Verrucomicrobiae bacterium]|nr:GDSL-type esterase/lipase family protein [Verrucomicrobiae bacterium]